MTKRKREGKAPNIDVDYYKILQVEKNAKHDDFKRAYRRLAMKWPDKNRTNKKEDESKFKEISKAYEVLSDPHKRSIYDQYGENGLKGHVPPLDAASSSGGTTFFSTKDIPTSFWFNPLSANDIFDEFFGFSDPFGGGMRLSFSFGVDVFRSFREGGGGVHMSQGGPHKAAPIENKLPCTLEEIYKGTTKKMKISREIIDANGKTMLVKEILTIDVKPGWKKGTKITFPEKGNEQPKVTPVDLVFIIDEKSHNVFTRDGNDLIVIEKVSLVEALTGYTVNITTLDGRNLSMPITNIIHPDYEEVVVREGVPLQKDPTKKGNLRIKFNIKFPDQLITYQKAGIKKLLTTSNIHID